jgi:hypothetical protein
MASPTIPARPLARRWLASAGVGLLLAIFLLPFFFVILRVMIFDAVPRDEYEPFLLWLLGQPGGNFPPSPYGYRVLAMVAAAPFYFVLPPVSFSGLPEGVSVPVLKATGAIAALSFLSIIGTSIMAYRLAVDKANLGRVEGLAAGVLAFFLCWHAAFYALDSASILMVAVGLYLVDRWVAFAPFAIMSVGFNEKIALVFVIWLVMRCVLFPEDRAKLGAPALAAAVAVACYVLLLMIVRLPGHAYQTDLASYPGTAFENLKAYFDMRGLLLNILPVSLLAGTALFSWHYLKQPFASGFFRPADVLVIVGLLLVALVATLYYQVGRIAMHAAPLYVVPAGAALGLWIRQLPRTAKA